MLFNAALVMAAVNGLAVLAAPADPTSPVAALATTSSIADSGPELLFAPNGPDSLRTKEEVYAALEKLVGASNPTGGPHRRTIRGPVPGKRYTWGTWVFVAGQFIVEQFGGTSWQFPTDGISIGYICDQVAGSIANTLGNGQVTRNVGGGWTWAGQIFQDNYDFNTIPYNLLYGIIYDAIQGSTDWLTKDNAFDFIVHDTNGKAILELAVFPTIRGGVVNWHDEL